jgi:hypothetical protein
MSQTMLLRRHRCDVRVLFMFVVSIVVAIVSGGGLGTGHLNIGVAAQGIGITEETEVGGVDGVQLEVAIIQDGGEGTVTTANGDSVTYFWVRDGVFPDCGELRGVSECGFTRTLTLPAVCNNFTTPGGGGDTVVTLADDEALCSGRKPAFSKFCCK